jgi:uncharacterized linocin/CFP29 family protein
MGSVFDVSGNAAVRDPDSAIGDNPSAAKIIVNGGDLIELRTNDLLRNQEWLRIDEEVQEISDQNLVLISDLREMNLVDPIDIGVLISSHEQATDVEDAEVTMSGEPGAEEDRREYQRVNYPVPFIQKSASFNARQLRASRQRGSTLDVDWATRATRKVTEKAEDIAFNSHPVQVGGDSIPGLRTESNRNQVNGSTWSTPSNIIPDLNTAIQRLLADGFNGPYAVYLGNEQKGQVKDLLGTGAGRVNENILEDEDIRFLKASGQIPDGEALVVQMTRDVIDIQMAEDIQTTDWESTSGRTTYVNTFTVHVVRVKSQVDGTSGIAHLTNLS